MVLSAAAGGLIKQWNHVKLMRSNRNNKKVYYLPMKNSAEGEEREIEIF